MPRFRSDDPWRVLWQIATSRRVLGALLLTLAVTLLLTAWLPQTSVGESDLDVTWQAQIQRRFGGDTWFGALRGPLQTIGAFHVTDAGWFRLLLALLSFSLLARLVDGVERLWRGRLGDVPSQDAAWIAQEGELEEAVDWLRRRRFRIVNNGETQDRDEAVQVVTCADRWPWGELGPVLVYLGGLTILAGMVITAAWGWQVGPLHLTTGESAPLGLESDLRLQLDELSPDGQRGAGQILGGENELAGASDLALGRPLTGAGSGAYLVGNGPALRIHAILSDTRVLGLVTDPDKEEREELVLAFTDEEPRYAVGVPDADLVLLLTMNQPVQMDALPHVQVFESGSGQFTLEQDALADNVIKVGGVSFILTPIPYAEIQVIRDPGAFWVQMGVICLIAGMALRGIWPPRRLWLRRQPNGLEMMSDSGLIFTLARWKPNPTRPDLGEE